MDSKIDTMKIKKEHINFRELDILDIGDWIDISVCDIEVGNNVPSKDNVHNYAIYNQDMFKTKHGYGETTKYTAGDVIKVNFGFSAELPKNKEAHVAPRSSTFKKYGLILTNSVGVIDESYRGIWSGVFLATRDGQITIGDKIAQFRTMNKMTKPHIEYIEELSDTERGSGGFGSTDIIS